MIDSLANKSRILLIGMLLTLPLMTFGQQRADFIRPFFGFYGSQSIGTAIGNATVAAGQLIPGATSNPANIGLSRFGHVQINFQNNSFSGPSVSHSSTVPGGIYAIVPVAVYQGGLAFSFGIQKEIDFSNGFLTNNGDANEGGGIYATEAGISYEAVKDFYLGGSLRLLRGSNQLSTEGSDSSSLLNPEYKGYYFTFGFLNRTSPNLNIGAAVDLPAAVDVDDKLTEWTVDRPDDAMSQTWNYTLKRPMVFRVGASLLYPLWSGFYELEWSDWSGLEFESSQYHKADVAIINNEITRDFKSGVTHHVGAAAHLPWAPVHLYAGYQYLPAPYGDAYKDDRRQSVSGGASYLLNQQFSLHSSLTNYFWSYKNGAGNFDKESNQMIVFGASLHF